jgi:MFS family permease
MTNLGPNAQTYLLAGEVFPRAVRGKGAGFAAAFAKIGAVATAFLFPILLTAIGAQALLYGLVAVSILGAVCQTASNRDPQSAWKRDPLLRLSSGDARSPSARAARRRGVSHGQLSCARRGVWGEVEQPVDKFWRARPGQLRFLSRQLSLPVSTMSQW